MTAVWRLLDHGPSPADWNLAVDEALLASHVDDQGPPTLRFYQWSTPTLSLGAGQKWPLPSLDVTCRDLGLAVVRRPTGGRAALHGGDLTYSLIAGARDGFPVSTTLVYRLLSQALKTGLKRLGIVAESGAAFRLGAAFACFALATPADLTWQGHKFMGSAQVWRGQSFLQQGSIILQSQAEIWPRLLSNCQPQSVKAMPLTAMAEILQLPFSLATLKTALLQGFQEALGVMFQAGELTRPEAIWAESRRAELRL
ncbi:MAG: lipoate--protein ligase family protein [Desulfobacca sp.]|nr:lipoate--protein ligase family protein [Desulfobacca sp.]